MNLIKTAAIQAQRCTWTTLSHVCTPYAGIADVEIKSRSDNVSSPSDSTGWRNPLPFSASHFKHSPWVGEAFWRDSLSSGGFGGNYLKSGSCNSLLAKNDLAYLPEHKITEIDIPFNDALLARALSSAYSKLKDQKVNYAVFLAESKQGFEMIHALASTIHRSMKAARQGDWVQATKGLSLSGRGFKSKDTFGRYLELTFGWQPLISDSLKIWDHLSSSLPSEIRFSVKGFAEENSELSFPYAMGGSNYYNGAGTQHGYTRQSCAVRMDFHADTNVLRKLVSTGFSNPVELIYEMTYLSWMVDYFSTLGKFVSALDADLGLEYKAGSFTQRIEKEIQIKALVGEYPGGPPPEGHSYTRTGSASCSSYGKRVKRTVLSAPPSVPIVGTIPGNWRQYANTFAFIAVQLLNRKGR